MNNEPDRDFRDLTELVDRSALIKTLARTIDRTEHIARRSRVVDEVAGVVRRFSALAPAERIRLAGMFLLAFSTGDFLLTLVVPLRSASALPAAIWATTGLVGLLFVVGARALATAWTTRHYTD